MEQPLVENVAVANETTQGDTASGKQKETYRVVITNEQTGETVRDVANVICMIAAITPDDSDESIGIGLSCCNATTILETIDTVQKVLERCTLHDGTKALDLMKLIKAIGIPIGKIMKETAECKEAQAPDAPIVH